jgi:SAM-dependent methyltransferase
MAEERLDQLLARLERERQEADRLYHAAFTALDRAIQRVPDAPHPPPAYDEQQITPINEAWNILPEGAPAPDASLKGRLRSFVWRLIGPPLERQRHFNSALVDHLNRNVAAHREAEKAIATTIELIAYHVAGAVQFQQYLIQYLQTITLYVDTKDRVAGGQAHVLNAALSGLTDDWLKRWESLTAREQRYEARNAALTQAIAEPREIALLAQQTAIALKRDMERVMSAAPRPSASAGAAAVSSSGDTVRPADVNSSIYVGFEDRFRGSREEIRARLTDYLPLFDGSSAVLDVGCGRGELLDLFRQHGIHARGIDVNADMVAECRERGLEADHVDALQHLLAQPDASLGGLIAIQVVEHLDPSYLMRFIETAQRKLRRGAPIVLETINVSCWAAFFQSYVRDVTHVRPLHPDTLSYFVQASGFSSVDVRYRSPVPDMDKLPRVSLPPGTDGRGPDPMYAEVADVINAHADRLNDRLFTFMDYAVVARA